MTTRLQIYNGALLVCGDRRIASLSENAEARYALDEVWNDGGVRYCLEQAQWHFAMCATRVDFNPSISPEWGYQHAFDKPSDWVNTSGVFQDDTMRTPLLQYADEVGYWFADREEIFVRYVSDGAAFGLDLSRWPSSFTDYVKAHFASRIIRRLPGGMDKIEEICHPTKGEAARRLLIAKNKAAMTTPATFPNRGTWAAARRGGARLRYDGGNPNSLIG